jgi:type II secretory pathway component PulK
MTMPRSCSARGERGVALVMVLLVVTLLMILVVEFTYTVRVESHISRNSLNALQATYLARSGINILAGALMDDEDNPAGVDPATEDGWRYFALGPCQNILENEESLPPEWNLCGRIVDESAKINVNFTRPQSARPNPNLPQECVPNNLQTLHYCWLDVLARLAENHGVPEEALQALEDYWYTAAPQQGAGQAAQMLAPEFGSFEDVAAAFPALRNKALFDQLRRYVTALPTAAQQRQVNFNLAPAPVLQAILEDEGMVQEILAQRAEAPFENCGQALEGLDAQNQAARRMCTTRSSVFRLEAVAVVNGVGKTVRALVERRSNRGGAAGGQGGGAGLGPLMWQITYLDWQKESGSRAAREMQAEGLDGPDNFANSEW